MQNLIIISNEKFSIKENSYFCNNKDLKVLPEKLAKFFKIQLIARRSGNSRFFQLNTDLLEVNIFTNLSSFLTSIKKTFGKSDGKYLIISLSPYTFCAAILLLIFGKRKYIYLRSDGFEEYRSILGVIGPFLYGIIFYIGSLKSSLIALSKKILRGKEGSIVTPSNLSNAWLHNRKKIKPKIANLLYLGRIRKEKGIFSLINLISDHKELKLQIVGDDEERQLNIPHEHIKTYPIECDEQKLIKIYDDCNIFILPSYTEGYGMVVTESLMRLRPVIIFREISHVAHGKKGVFVCDRDTISLKNSIHYIIENYENIQKDIEQQTLDYVSQVLKQVLINTPSDQQLDALVEKAAGAINEQS